MATPPTLLDSDGIPSMATALMMSHHAFRRDLGRFRHALQAVDVSRVQALRDEWGNYHAALHGHHEAEDQRLFPGLSAQHAALTATIERLSADHRRIDPLLAEGDRAFAELPNAGAALAVIEDLAALLAPHLALEEVEIIPFLRDIRQFPAPASDDEAALFADGFAWSSQGIAEDVLATMFAVLPDALRSRISAAREKFAARWQRVWGDVPTTQSRTPVPAAD
jgi:hemerythrin-like domain-containing protein